MKQYVSQAGLHYKYGIGLSASVLWFFFTRVRVRHFLDRVECLCEPRVLGRLDFADRGVQGMSQVLCLTLRLDQSQLCLSQF